MSRPDTCAGRQHQRAEIILPVALLLFTLLAGCAIQPTLPHKIQNRMKKYRHPYGDEQLFTYALDCLAVFINMPGKKQFIVTVKPILNCSATAGVPFNLTTMSEGALNHLVGRNFHVLPIDTFNGAPCLYPLKYKPSIYLAGGITRFDKDIEVKEGDRRLDVLFGGGDTETDMGFGLFDSCTVSSIAATMYLTSVRDALNLPGESVENTIDVLKVSRKRHFGFVVHGSGLDLNGRIEKTQGLHKAVKNLIDLSILQLFSRLYNYPYWLDLGTGQADPEVCASLLRTFSKKNRRSRIRCLQQLLGRLVAGEVINPRTGRPYPALTIDGKWGPASRAYAGQFIRQQHLPIQENDFPALYKALLHTTPLPSP